VPVDAKLTPRVAVGLVAPPEAHVKAAQREGGHLVVLLGGPDQQPPAEARTEEAGVPLAVHSRPGGFGVADAWNMVLDETRFDCPIATLAPGELRPGSLAALADAFADPAVGAVVADALVNGVRLWAEPYDRARPHTPPPALAVRADAAAAVNGFDAAAADPVGDFLKRLSTRYLIGHLPAILYAR
jgi:hypothetical protein